MNIKQIKKVLDVIDNRVKEVASPIFYEELTGKRIQKAYAQVGLQISTNEAIHVWGIMSDEMYAASFMDDEGFTDVDIINNTKDRLIRAVVELVNMANHEEDIQELQKKRCVKKDDLFGITEVPLTYQGLRRKLELNAMKTEM